jgi:hypothetical protein
MGGVLADAEHPDVANSCDAPERRDGGGGIERDHPHRVDVRGAIACAGSEVEDGSTVGVPGMDAQVRNHRGPWFGDSLPKSGVSPRIVAELRIQGHRRPVRAARNTLYDCPSASGR